MKNCQVFTSPDVVEKMLDLIGYNSDLMGSKTLENSFGSGNFLLAIVKRYILVSLDRGHTPSDISRGLSHDIYGYEIDSERFKQTIYKLNLLINEYEIPKVDWKLRNSDYLSDKLDMKFDYIIGNPPYIDYRDLESSLRDSLRSFDSCKTGKFDYCYPFIEKSIMELSNTGKMCYLVPNSVFKNVFASNLREIIRPLATDIYKISNAAFTEKALVSPVILILDRTNDVKQLRYHPDNHTTSTLISKDKLGHKWTFLDQEKDATKKERFGDYFNASLSMVTMCNEAFVLRNLEHEGRFYKNANEMLEADLIRIAVSPKSMKSGDKEYVIFPYIISNGAVKRIKKDQFEKDYPGIAKHLLNYKEKLSKRDVDKGAEYYEYGRSQGLKYANTEKLLMSTIITNHVRVELVSSTSIPYSGIVITSKEKGYDLDLAKKILLSPEFIQYAKAIGVSVSGSSVRITSKDINNFRFDGVKR